MQPRLVELRLARSVLVAALLFASRAAGAPTYVVTDLGTRGGQTSVGQAINAAGQVTGSAEIGTHMLHAFLFSGGVMSDVGTFGGTASFGYGINRAGDVVGAAYDAGSAPRAHAFLYHGA